MQSGIRSLIDRLQVIALKNRKHGRLVLEWWDKILTMFERKR